MIEAVLIGFMLKVVARMIIPAVYLLGGMTF